ncbi:Uncharacterised protein [Sphingobacterium spiritivorum]|uniref:Uncharacterized protein n=1 Tax=Sphingobacterium spiritivorum TaxID=258 RepID=A0A380BPT7_SPHSI|nr:Uncharacterised protein [Sphingobacterium spiritivorum]
MITEWKDFYKEVQLSSGGNIIMEDDCTLNHETLHSLGLNHTHRDERPIPTAGYRYTFPCAISKRSKAVANSRTPSDKNVIPLRYAFYVTPAMACY